MIWDCLKKKKVFTQSKEHKMSEIISNEELIFSNMIEIQAIIKILTKNGITTEDEILAEVKKLKVEMEEKIKKMGREN